jgi:hypothetical protein
MNCFTQYIELLLSESYPGTCPVLKCPLCRGATCFIQSKDLQLLPNELIEKYSSLASSLLSLQCGSCHQRSSLFLPSSVDPLTSAAATAFQSILLNEYGSFLDDLLRYECGQLSIADFYLLITSKYFQEMTTSTNNNSSWATMKSILSLVRNPERRANLHLRYLKHHPFVLTNCCSRPQCFECRTTDTHQGKSCHEVSHSRTNSEMIKCPTCSIQIVKGDGCDSVSCVCGSKFTFSTELRKFNQSNLFAESYPNDTAHHCVLMLCGEYPLILSSIPLAKAWYDIHITECQRSFLQFWGQKYPFCPTQSALVATLKPSDSSAAAVSANEYLEKSRQMWIQFHEKEYQKRKADQIYAQLCLWESLYPSPHFKRQAAAAASTKLFSENSDPMLRGLTKSQKDRIHSLLDHFIRSDPLSSNNSLNQSSLSRSSALQFLTLFGHFPVGLMETKAVDGILLNAHLATIHQSQSHSSSDSSFFGPSLIYEEGDVVSSLLARHQRSLGVILHRYEEDNTYDVHWLSINQIERIPRNYLKFKGKGKMLQPLLAGAETGTGEGREGGRGGGFSKDHLQMFKHLLKYLHLLLSPSPPPAPVAAPTPGREERYSSEETKDDPSSSSSSVISSILSLFPKEAEAKPTEDPVAAFEKRLVSSWEQKCVREGISPEAELQNMNRILDLFQAGDQLEPLCDVSQLYSQSTTSPLCWRDLYGAVLWKLNSNA